MSNDTITFDDVEINACEVFDHSGNQYMGMRIAAIFIILFTSLFGVLFPILSTRVKRLGIPEWTMNFFKYFGSGVLIATAFIHLLAPAFESLNSPCLTGVWTVYPWAPALAMCSIFFIFIVELIAHRSGSTYLRSQGVKAHDTHQSNSKNKATHTSHGLHTSEPNDSLAERAAASGGKGMDSEESIDSNDISAHHQHHHEGDQETLEEKAMAQIIGVALLEFGIVLHSFVIGLTLAVNAEFYTIFTVLIFHQMFEGLGLGSRLSVLPLPSKLNWVPYLAGTFYASITPLGIAVGLGIRHTYNPDSATAVIVSGVLDSLSAGVLIYTGLVELIAHEFIFNKEMAQEASNSKVAFSVGSVMLGAGLMAVLGFWV